MLRPTFLKNRESLIFELTNRCNLKCSMCDIWKEYPKTDFNIDVFEYILKSRRLKSIREISLTGGEPFMIKNLEDYYFLIRRYLPKAFINISSNGNYTNRILNFLKKVDKKKTSITLSYDGLRSHDIIRGRPNSAKRLLNTVRKTKIHFPEIALSLKFTILAENKYEIFDTARQAAKMKVPFRIKIEEQLNCHQTRNVQNRNDKFDKDSLKTISGQTRKILKLNIQTNRHYIKQLINKKNRQRLTCNWSKRTLFIGLDGKVFLCRKKQSIGNINHGTIEEIIDSKERKSALDQMKKCEDYSCFSYMND